MSALHVQSWMQPYLAHLEERLTPTRLQHSLRVMRVMDDLSDIYGLERRTALLAGLLHDIAKDLTPTQLLALGEEAELTWEHPCEREPIYLHAPVGGYLVAQLLPAETAVAQAIATHSYVPGAAFDAPLSRCLRLADLLAPVNAWLGMRKLRAVAYAGRSDEAALLQATWLIEYMREIQIPVHPYLEQYAQDLAARVPVDTDFFVRW